MENFKDVKIEDLIEYLKTLYNQAIEIEELDTTKYKFDVNPVWKKLFMFLKETGFVEHLSSYDIHIDNYISYKSQIEDFISDLEVKANELKCTQYSFKTFKEWKTEQSHQKQISSI